MGIRDRLEDLYPVGAVERLLSTLQGPDLAGRLRDAMKRAGWKDAKQLEHLQRAWREARNWLDSISSQLAEGEASSLIINATGQLFSPGLAGPAVSVATAHEIASAASHFQHAETLHQHSQAVALRHLNTHVSWHNDVASLLHIIFRSHTVVMARSDVQRVAGIGALDAMLEGLPVIEVGASNGAQESDWKRGVESCGESSSAKILLVSPNSLSTDMAAKQREAALRVAHQADVEVVELAADATIDARLHEVLGAPLLGDLLKSHDGVVVAPLQVFWGAPGGCAACGSAERTGQLRRDAEARGSGLSHAIQRAATLLIELAGANTTVETGVTARLTANVENLADRARRMAIQIAGTSTVLQAEAIQRDVPLGPAPWDRYQLHNWAVRAKVNGSAAEIASRLAKGLPAFSRETPSGKGNLSYTRIGATVDGEDQLIIDLRFVEPRDDHLIVHALCGDLSDTTVEGELGND